MNRRNFLKSIGRICAVLPFVGSSSAVAKTGASKSKSGCSWKGKLKCGGQDGTLCPRCKYNGNKVNLHNYPVRPGWKFYINGKEIDSSRAVDELGALCWPFQGAKEGDLCTAKSPKVVMAHCPNRFMFTI